MPLFKTSRFFLYAAVFFVAIMSTNTLFPFIVGKYVWFRVSVDLALITFLLGLIFDQEADAVLTRLKTVFKSPLTWAVSAFVLAVMLAVLFGYNSSFSFWSNFERGEGGLQMLHLYLFFLLLITLFKDEKNWRMIFWCSIIGAYLMILYGVGAGIGPNALGGIFKNFIGSTFNTPGFRFSGSIGNPAYVATYLIFLLFFTAYLWVSGYFKNWKSWRSWLLLLTVLVFIVFFLLAATRGAVIGMVAAGVIALVYLGLNRPRLRNWTIGLALAAVILFGTMVALKDTKFVQSLGPVARIFDISVTTKTFSDRSDIWKMAWDGWKARPIFGWGPENFLQVFDRYFNTRYFDPAAGFGAWFDRAHSFIFDYLAETGILGLLGYLSMFAAFYWLFFKNRIKGRAELNHALVDDLFFALPIAYLIQALVLFDVLVIYVNLFMFMAFAYYYFHHRRQEFIKT